MSDWVGGFIAVALTQAAGAGWLALLTPRRRSRSERWALAWVLGTLFSTCVVWCVGVSGLPWHPLALAFPHVAVAAWGATRARRRPLQPEPVPARSMKPAQMASSTGDGSARVRLALKLALGLVVLLVAAHTLREGARFADSHAVWALRAKVVAIDGGFDGSYWQDWHDSHDRRAYPPLLSLSAA